MFDASVMREDRRQDRASQEVNRGIGKVAVASNTRLSGTGTFGGKRSWEVVKGRED